MKAEQQKYLDYLKKHDITKDTIKEATDAEIRHQNTIEKIKKRMEMLDVKIQQMEEEQQKYFSLLKRFGIDGNEILKNIQDKNKPIDDLIRESNELEIKSNTILKEAMEVDQEQIIDHIVSLGKLIAKWTDAVANLTKRKKEMEKEKFADPAAISSADEKIKIGLERIEQARQSHGKYLQALSKSYSYDTTDLGDNDSPWDDGTDLTNSK